MANSRARSRAPESLAHASRPGERTHRNVATVTESSGERESNPADNVDDAVTVVSSCMPPESAG
jgi:hypothetical protein